MRVTFTVHGRVQGVGFRYFVQENAESLGLSGFVRNEWNGTVTGVAEGEAAPLQALRQALERGNSYSRVSRLDWSPLFEGESLPFPFEIRP